jgi:hypothetical protein
MLAMALGLALLAYTIAMLVRQQSRLLVFPFWRTYQRNAKPRRYWLSIGWNVFVSIVFICLGLTILFPQFAVK